MPSSHTAITSHTKAALNYASVSTAGLNYQHAPHKANGSNFLEPWLATIDKVSGMQTESHLFEVGHARCKAHLRCTPTTMLCSRPTTILHKVGQTKSVFAESRFFLAGPCLQKHNARV